MATGWKQTPRCLSVNPQLAGAGAKSRLRLHRRPPSPTRRELQPRGSLTPPPSESAEPRGRTPHTQLQAPAPETPPTGTLTRPAPRGARRPAVAGSLPLPRPPGPRGGQGGGGERTCPRRPRPDNARESGARARPARPRSRQHSPSPGSPAEAQGPPGAARGHEGGAGAGEAPRSRPATRPQRPRSPRKHTARRSPPVRPSRPRTSAPGAGRGARARRRRRRARGPGAGLAGMWAGPGLPRGLGPAQGWSWGWRRPDSDGDWCCRTAWGAWMPVLAEAPSFIIFLPRRWRVPASGLTDRLFILPA